MPNSRHHVQRHCSCTQQPHAVSSRISLTRPDPLACAQAPPACAHKHPRQHTPLTESTNCVSSAWPSWHLLLEALLLLLLAAPGRVSSEASQLSTAATQSRALQQQDAGCRQASRQDSLQTVLLHSHTCCGSSVHGGKQGWSWGSPLAHSLQVNTHNARAPAHHDFHTYTSRIRHKVLSTIIYEVSSDRPHALRRRRSRSHTSWRTAW
jgi:hypothetical protein